MKRIKCEMCGSSDLVKQDGLFVCQSCGTKYTVEEARKMMVEGTVEVKGTVAIDKTDSEAQYMSILETSINSSNYEEIYNVSSKLVEINTKNWKGWFYKGIGAGYSSKGGNNRFKESIACFDKAYSVAPTSEKVAVAEMIVNATISISKTLFDFYCGLFIENISDDNVGRVSNAAQMSLEEISKLPKKYNVSYLLTHDAEDTITKIFYETLRTAKNNADARFGRRADERTDFAFDIYIRECDAIITLATVLITMCPIRYGALDDYYALLQKTVKSTTHSCSYSYSGSAGKYVKSKTLTHKAVRARNEAWESINSLRNKLATSMNQRQTTYQLLRNETYWKEHAKEKEELLSKKESLQKSIKPYTDQIEEIEKKIETEKENASKDTEKEANVNKTVDSISVLNFKKKEAVDKASKKELKVEIKLAKKQLKQDKKAAKAERKETNNAMRSRITELENEKQKIINTCSEVNKELKHIEDELTKNR